MVVGVASRFGARACATVATVARSLMFEPLGRLRLCVRYACRLPSRSALVAPARCELSAVGPLVPPSVEAPVHH